MKAITKLRFHTGLTLDTVKSLVNEARYAAIREARECGQPFIPSRGVWLCTLDREGSQCGPAVEAECPEWKGTQKEIEKLLDLVIAKYPEVAKIYIAGGYDCSPSPAAYRDGDYEPWASSWSVDVWVRKN